MRGDQKGDESSLRWRSYGVPLENSKENFGEDQRQSRIPICKQKNGTHPSSNFEGKCGREEFVFNVTMGEGMGTGIEGGRKE